MLFSQIRIENTNQCSYHCSICPREKMTREVGIMSLEDFSYLLDCLNFPFERILHLHGYGEPLWDPHLLAKIAKARNKWPSAQILFYSTLGARIVEEEEFFQMMEAGLTSIYVSCYGYSRETYLAIHGVDRFDCVMNNLEKLHKAKERFGKKFTCVLLIPFQEMLLTLKINERERKNFLRNMMQIGVRAFAETELHNFGRGRNYHSPRQRPCPRVSPLTILQITWDLKVIPCCVDFNAEMVLGDLKKESLREILSHTPYQDLVKAHLFSQLTSFPICQQCDQIDLN